VLELGAGVGLLSLVASQFSPIHITSTDGNEIVLEILSRNLEEHNVRNIPHSTSLLEWGKESAVEFKAKYCLSPSNALFDCVLIADCTYSADCTILLIESVRELLATNGVCLIAHKSRWGIVDRALNDHLLKSKEFVIEDLPLTSKVIAQNPPEDEGDVSVLNNTESSMHLYRIRWADQ
jgi:predicted nicotinamide N-methyase